jgi:hypothetical protein
VFFTTSQHDPNIVPWSRRYILFVIPGFAIFFGYLIFHMIKTRAMSHVFVKSFSLAIVALIIIKGFYFIFNSEYSHVEPTIQAMAADEHIKRGIVLFDVNSDRGTIDNTKFCEPLNIVYNVTCYYVPRLDLPFNKEASKKEIFLISTRGNLEKNRFELIKRFDTVMDAYGNSFYAIPDTKRQATSIAYLYRFKFIPEEIPETNTNPSTSR